MQVPRPADGEFDVEQFERAVDVIFMAQEILVSNSSYPTDRDRRQRATRCASSASATRTSARC